jgi:hypothetical protein
MVMYMLTHALLTVAMQRRALPHCSTSAASLHNKLRRTQLQYGHSHKHCTAGTHHTQPVPRNAHTYAGQSLITMPAAAAPETPHLPPHHHASACCAFVQTIDDSRPHARCSALIRLPQSNKNFSQNQSKVTAARHYTR